MPGADSEIEGVELPLVGLHGARTRILQAIRKQESLLLMGPPGSGKSRLLRFAAESAGGDAIHLGFRAVLHDLLAAFAARLIYGAHRPFIRLANPKGDPEAWAAGQMSIRLKGLIWSALESEPRLLLLDGIDNASHPMYRFFQRLYHTSGMRIIAAARHPARMGALQRLFWDPRFLLRLPPLNHAESLQLFELAAGYFNLHSLDLEDFRPRVMDSAQGNPGKIVEMCRLASNPQYVSGARVKFAPLWIDVTTRFAP